MRLTSIILTEQCRLLIAGRSPWVIYTHHRDRPIAYPCDRRHTAMSLSVRRREPDYQHSMKTTVTITPEIAEILERSTIEGDTLRLPQQLERKTYATVNKVLELAGGRWNRKGGVHVFPSDPRPFLGMAVAQGTVSAVRLPVCQMVTPKGEFTVSADQLFPTPEPLAGRMIVAAKILPFHDVLEPSGGSGALIAALYRSAFSRASNGTGRVFVVEKDQTLFRYLLHWESNIVFHIDFLKITPGGNDRGEGCPLVDRIVMNPPFVNCQDIDHIQHAYRFLKPGGRLVAICANGPRQQAKLRPWVEALEGDWYDLPPGSFTASGTSVNAAMIVVDLTPGV